MILGITVFWSCIAMIPQGLPWWLYVGIMVSIAMTITGGAEAFRFLFWFRPEKCKTLLHKNPDKIRYVGLERHWILGWKLEFGSYGAETYRIVGKQNPLWSYFMALSELNEEAELKFPEAFLTTLTDTEKSSLLPRRVKHPTVSY